MRLLVISFLLSFSCSAQITVVRYIHDYDQHYDAVTSEKTFNTGRVRFYIDDSKAVITLYRNSSNTYSSKREFTINSIQKNNYDGEFQRKLNTYKGKGEVTDITIRYWIQDGNQHLHVNDGEYVTTYKGKIVIEDTTSDQVELEKPKESTAEAEVDHIPTGNSNTDNSPFSSGGSGNNEENSQNPFGVGFGNGGNGDGGYGEGVGGNGTGNGPGNGVYNPNRKVVKHPVFNAQAQEEGKIALDIWVDANGNVVRIKFKESKSTSGSAYLIKLAKKAAMTMKYDQKPGAKIEHVGYKVFAFRKA